MHLSHTCLSSQFAFNQHEFLKGGTQKETEDRMLSTLKESISIPGRMICLLHPWHDPMTFRRVWCLYELFTAFELGAEVLFVFPPKVLRIGLAVMLIADPAVD